MTLQRAAWEPQRIEIIAKPCPERCDRESRIRTLEAELRRLSDKSLTQILVQLETKRRSQTPAEPWTDALRRLVGRLEAELAAFTPEDRCHGLAAAVQLDLMAARDALQCWQAAEAELLAMLQEIRRVGRAHMVQFLDARHPGHSLAAALRGDDPEALLND
jgi:hypothetical protein